jgi:signal peptide peptidase SppA
MNYARTLQKLQSNPLALMPEAYRTILSSAEDMIRGDIDLEDIFGPQLPAFEQVGKVGIVNVSGVILPSATKFEQLLGAASLKDIRGAIKLAKNTESVEHVIVRFNTPGGSVVGLEQTAKALKAIGKPTTAHVDELCASAGYWLAAQCDEILASESAQIGSIGVYMAFLTMERGLIAQGVTPEVIQAGKYKTLGIAIKDLTDEDRAYLQASIDETKVAFEAAVSSRKLSEDTMQGEVYEGEKALELNLIDGLQDDFEELIQVLNS